MFWCFGKNLKTHHCKIVLLDETEFIHEFQDNSRGQQLLDVVFKHLNLMETAYFGLRYLDTTGQRHWLDPNKSIMKQLKGLETFTFYFGIKFYASDPCKLLEEITRYQFFLQVKQDIYQGRLLLTFELAAELLAYCIQSELGDFDPRRNLPGYVAEFRFSTNQTSELEAKAADIHKSLSGRVPAIAELNFLDRVKWLDMYGVDLHPVLGEDNIEYFLGLTPSGILVLRNKSKVGNYFWPRISKVYYKRKYFMLRIKEKSNEESTYGFELPNKQACKHLWKCCIEHRGFFKLTQIKEPGQPGKIFGIENKFMYSGLPEKNIQMTGVQAKLRTPPTFIRVPSRRYQKRLGQPDGADAGTQAKEEINTDVRLIESRPSLPPSNQPILIPSLHRSTSVPSVAPVISPYRVVSPWENSSTRGLYSGCANPSPRSVRSAGAQPSRRFQNRTGSIDSSASYDNKRRKHHHHSRRQSDNESEISKSSRCSKNSRSSRNGHSRHRSQSTEGSDSESQQRHRRHSRRRKHGSNYDLVESESQWREIQQQNRGQNLIHMQNAVVKDLSKRRSGYMNSGLETETETNYSQRRRHRRHNSRSRSPETNKNAIPNEVKKHIEYSLIDPNTLTEEERRNIKYTKVQSDSRFFKIRYSPPSGRGHHQENQITEQNGDGMEGPKQHNMNQSNGNLVSQQFGNCNNNDGNLDYSQRTLPQIPKLNMNGLPHNGCIVNTRRPSITNFAEERARIQFSNPNLVTNWNQNNGPISNSEKKIKKENIPRNSNCQQLENSHFMPTQERQSNNLRMVNGHYFPAPLKPQGSLPPMAPRVTFQGDNPTQHHQKTFNPSKSCTQYLPRQNGEVTKQAPDQQNHEMSTEL